MAEVLRITVSAYSIFSKQQHKIMELIMRTIAVFSLPSQGFTVAGIISKNTITQKAQKAQKSPQKKTV